MFTWRKFKAGLIGAVLGAVGVSFFAAPVQAQQKQDAAQAEAAQQSAMAEITKTATEFVAAFEKGDAKAVAAFWAPDADYEDQQGHVLKGRKAIEDDFAASFAENKGAKLRIEVASRRFPTPDTAVEDGVTSVLAPDGSLPERTRYSNLLVKRDGRWLLQSVREAPYTPPNNYDQLRPLQWLIGEWAQDTKEPQVARVIFDWSPDKNFIIVTRLVDVKDAVLENGHQRIGWDAAARQLRSWTFESDGGFAEGAWIPEGDKWVNRVSAVTKSGSLMVSTLVVTRVDPDTIKCEAKEQVLDGNKLPDPPAITMKRIN